MRVRFTRKAQANLDSIFRYVAAHNPRAALEIIESVTALADKLRLFPDMGRPTRPPGRRVLIVPRVPYRLFYRVVDGEIRILSIRHTSRRTLQETR